MVISSSSVPGIDWVWRKNAPQKPLDADEETVLDWESEGGSNVQVPDEVGPSEEGLGLVEESPE